MPSGHEKGSGHVLIMATPCHTTESVPLTLTCRNLNLKLGYPRSGSHPFKPGLPLTLTCRNLNSNLGYHCSGSHPFKPGFITRFIFLTTMATPCHTTESVPLTHTCRNLNNYLNLGYHRSGSHLFKTGFKTRFNFFDNSE